MALPYPEGEVLFRRSALTHRSGFNANNESSFYSHALVESVWNVAFTQDRTVATNNFQHRRSTMRVVTGSGWRTQFGFWDHQRISFGDDRRGGRITRRVALANNDNGNEARDFDSGGPHKVCIMPVLLGKERYMYMDMTAMV